MHYFPYPFYLRLLCYCFCQWSHDQFCFRCLMSTWSWEKYDHIGFPYQKFFAVTELPVEPVLRTSAGTAWVVPGNDDWQRTSLWMLNSYGVFFFFFSLYHSAFSQKVYIMGIIRCKTLCSYCKTEQLGLFPCQIFAKTKKNTFSKKWHYFRKVMIFEKRWEDIPLYFTPSFLQA